MNKQPPSITMTPMEIEETYKLSELIELAQLECSHAVLKEYTNEYAFMGKKQKVERATCTVTFKRDKHIYTCPHFDGPYDAKNFNYQSVLSCLNDDCLQVINYDAFLPEEEYTNVEKFAEKHKNWIQGLKDDMGTLENLNIDATVLLTIIKRYYGMKRVLQEWFPVFLYAERDI